MITKSRLNPKAAAETVVSGIELQQGDILLGADRAEVVSVVPRGDKIQVEIRTDGVMNDLMLDPKGKYRILRKVEAAKVEAANLKVGDIVRIKDRPDDNRTYKISAFGSEGTPYAGKAIFQQVMPNGKLSQMRHALDPDMLEKFVVAPQMEPQAMKATATIKKESDGYHVYSESGKNLGGPYTKEKAEERLKEIEAFKHMKKKAEAEPRSAGNEALRDAARRMHDVGFALRFLDESFQTSGYGMPTSDKKANDEVRRLKKENGIVTSQELIPYLENKFGVKLASKKDAERGWGFLAKEKVDIRVKDEEKRRLIYDEAQKIWQASRDLGMKTYSDLTATPVAVTAKRDPHEMDETYADDGQSRFFREGDKFYFTDIIDGKSSVKELTDSQADEVRAALADISGQGLGMSEESKVSVVRQAIRNLVTKKNRWADAAKEGEWVIKYDNGVEVGATKGGLEISRVRIPSRKSSRGIERGGVRYEVKMPNGTTYSAHSLQSAMEYADKEKMSADAKQEEKMATRAELEKTHGDTTRQIATRAVSVVNAVRRTYHGLHASAVKPYTDVIGVKARQLYNETHAENWTTTDAPHIGTDAMKIRSEIDGLQRDIRSANLPVGLSRIFANHLLDALRGLREAIDNL